MNHGVKNSKSNGRKPHFRLGNSQRFETFTTTTFQHAITVLAKFCHAKNWHSQVKSSIQTTVIQVYHGHHPASYSSKNEIRLLRLTTPRGKSWVCPFLEDKVFLPFKLGYFFEKCFFTSCNNGDLKTAKILYRHPIPFQWVCTSLVSWEKIGLTQSAFSNKNTSAGVTKEFQRRLTYLKTVVIPKWRKERAPSQTQAISYPIHKELLWWLPKLATPWKYLLGSFQRNEQLIIWLWIIQINLMYWIVFESGREIRASAGSNAFPFAIFDILSKSHCENTPPLREVQPTSLNVYDGVILFILNGTVE